MSVSRRSVLGLGALGVSSLLTPASALASSAMPKGKKAKNIIFCVSDGMSMGVPTMADHLSQILEGKNSYWAWLMKQDYAVLGLQDTRSLNSLVTDSSAAASAWGCGRHIWNGQVNMFPDDTKLRTLTQLMAENKVRCGLVTTATITHATPAGFCVNAPARDDQDFIASEYLSSGVDVLMGGGQRYFDPEQRKDKRDLFADFAKAGYTVAKTRDDLMAAKGKKVLGLFSKSHMPYWVDHKNDGALMKLTPTLAEMAKAAIENLKDSPNGFLLQIEGAKVDHAAHSNDLAGLIYDQIAFEEAVKVAIEFALADGETLVVITSDHGNGNPGLNGYGAEYIQSTAGLKSVAQMTASYEKMNSIVGKDVTKWADVIQSKLGITLTPAEAEVLMAEKSPYASSIFYGNKTATLGVVLGNHTKITWTSTNHTSDHVLVTAVGPGAEQFSGLTQNISYFDWILAHKGLKHSNPTMTFEKAKELYEKRKKPDPMAMLDRDGFEVA